MRISSFSGNLNLPGAQALQQFLRLRVAQALGSSTHPRAKTQDLRDAFARGEALEVAGYLLAPGLALGLEAANLSLPQHAIRAAWIEIVPDADTAVRPARRDARQRLAQLGSWTRPFIRFRDRPSGKRRRSRNPRP